MRTWGRVALLMFGVAWGANQFTPLLLVYRTHDGLTASATTAAFGTYAAGLIPALLLAVPLVARTGRAPLVRSALGLSAAASLVLLLGGANTAALDAGRLLAGIASGAAFGPGTAWIKDLSAGTATGTAARRAALALTAGFAGGPLVAGLLAQWAPAPESLPYLVHIALAAVIALLTLRLPAPGTPGAPAAPAPWSALFRHPVLRREVAVTAPLVFAAAATALAAVPGLLPPHRAEIATAGIVAGITLGCGLLVQPATRRWAVRAPHATRTAGLLAATAGFALGAAAVATGQFLLLLPTGLALGACYGVVLVSGLTRIEAFTPPGGLTTAVAVFYCLTYVGFAEPYVIATLHPWVPPAVQLAAAAVLAALLIPLTAPRGRSTAAGGDGGAAGCGDSTGEPARASGGAEQH